MTLTVPQPALQRIVADCVRQSPREAVGLLAAPVGSVDTVQAVAAAHNRSSTPTEAFYVDPHEQWRLETAFEASGLVCIGSYHSHPTKSAEPSGMDCEFMGDRIMLIVGGRGVTYTHRLNESPVYEGADVRAWRAVNGHTEQVELEIVTADQIARHALDEIATSPADRSALQVRAQRTLDTLKGWAA